MASDLVKWAKSPQNRQVVKAVGVLAAATVGATVLWYAMYQKEIEETGGLFKAMFEGMPGKTSGTRKAPKQKEEIDKGRVVCPKDVGKIPPSVTDLKRGDFVIVSLAESGGPFVESTWARVRSLSPSRDRVYVEIVGEFTNQGIKPIATRKHGFYLGEKLVLDAVCIFDVLRTDASLTGQILCGPNLNSVVSSSGAPMYSPVDTRRVTSADLVRIVVASKESQGSLWHEPLWVHVTSVSPTSQVIHGSVAETPARTPQHGLSRFSRVEFGRDCVVGVSNPYLLGET